MPTLHHYWTCNVCGVHYDDESGAVRCEGREARAAANRPPRGLIRTFDYLAHQNRGDDLFAELYTGDLLTAGPLSHRDHHGHYLFRGNGAGDDVVTQRNDPIGGGANPNGGDGDTVTTSPTFARALAHCRRLGWQPFIMRGGAVVPYEDEPQ